MGNVYFITDCKNIKIGYTKQKNVYKRLKQIQTGSPDRLYLLGYFFGTMSDEKYLHKLFAKERIRDNGEWFRASNELIEYINTHNEKENCYVDWVDGKLMSLLSV